MNRIVKHYLPVTATNEVQLCVKLYQMKWTPGKLIDTHANEIQAIASRINKIQSMIRPEPLNPSYIGKKDMVAILIISLLKEYDTEITLIERNNKIDFKTALEMLRAWELRLKAAREEGNVNAVQGSSNN